MTSIYLSARDKAWARLEEILKAQDEEVATLQRELAEARAMLDDALTVLEAPATSSHKAKRELAAKMRAALRAAAQPKEGE